ncbi:MAG: succinylglutamate desuccinylase/aspartoacylase family protein, partial [candidate division KSB1 bacterium]
MNRALQSNERMRAIFLTLGLLSATTFAQPRSSFTAGPITARVGEKASGIVQIAALNDEGTTIPISIVHGAKPGPVLGLIAGNHGYEYAPIIALQNLLPQLDPKQMAGTVIMIHVANMPSFLRRTIYYSPVDGKNLNRMYPGKLEGTISERIAYHITQDVIER